MVISSNKPALMSANVEILKNSGEVVFPAASLLNLVWETFGLMTGVPQMKVKVMFEDVKFSEVLKLKENQDVSLLCHIHRGKFIVKLHAL